MGAMTFDSPVDGFGFRVADLLLGSIRTEWTPAALIDGYTGAYIDFTSQGWTEGDVISGIEGFTAEGNPVFQNGGLYVNGDRQALRREDIAAAFRQYPFTMIMVADGPDAYCGLQDKDQSTVRYGLNYRNYADERVFSSNPDFVAASGEAGEGPQFVAGVFEESGLTAYIGSSVKKQSTQPADGDVDTLSIGALVDSSPSYGEATFYQYLIVNRALSDDEIQQFRDYHGI